MNNRQHTCSSPEDQLIVVSGGTVTASASAAASSMAVTSSGNSPLGFYSTVQEIPLSCPIPENIPQDPLAISSGVQDVAVDNAIRSDTRKPEKSIISPPVLQFYIRDKYYESLSGSKSGGNPSATESAGETSKVHEDAGSVSKEKTASASPSPGTSRSYNLRTRTCLSTTTTTNNHLSSDCMLELPKAQHSRGQIIMQESTSNSSSTGQVTTSREVTSSGIPHNDGDLKGSQDKRNPPGWGPFKCTHCDRRYVRKRDLRQHTLSHTTDACKCLVCSKSYTSVSGMLFHLRKLHGQVKFYNCSRCRVFTTLSQEDFRAHMAQVHKTKTRKSPRATTVAAVGSVVKTALLDKARTPTFAGPLSESSIFEQAAAVASKQSSSQKSFIENGYIVMPTEPRNLPAERSLTSAAASVLQPQTTGNGTAMSSTIQTTHLQTDLGISSDNERGHFSHGIGPIKQHCSRCDRSFYMEQRLKTHSCFPKKVRPEEPQVPAPSNPLNPSSNLKVKPCSVSLSRLTDAEISSLSSRKPAGQSDDILSVTFVATTAAAGLAPEKHPATTVSPETCENNGFLSSSTVPKAPKVFCPCPPNAQVLAETPAPFTNNSTTMNKDGVRRNPIIAHSWDPTNCEELRAGKNNCFSIPPKMSSYIAQCICTSMCMILGERMFSSGCFCPGKTEPAPTTGHGITHGHYGPGRYMNAEVAVEENSAGENPSWNHAPHVCRHCHAGQCDDDQGIRKKTL